MSTDSEDLDEDELLQMALKEQAERDTNYQKPPSKSSKPVANYVQPPSNKGSSSASKNPNPRQRNYTKSRAKASKDDADSQWAGGEPDSWKRVDESELARRVREMREARAVPVPVVPKVEHKPSALGKKGLANLQSFPRGMECIDPLGLGIIDNRTLKLITDTSDSSPSRERDNINNDLREKLAYFSEKFDAKLFLSRIHQDTSAADLEAGAHAIKTDLKGRTQQRKNLVKENFDCFVSCKTTIDDIESKLKRIEEDPEGAGTMHLYNIIQGVSSQATRAFEPLFERQAQAEKIRSVQGMLQRFRTLFNLPSTIRASISNGEHDLAVREYKKAKSIALPSHIGILKRVLEEVEKVMHEFKGTLYKTMEDPQIDLTDVMIYTFQSHAFSARPVILLENTVRLLLELEPESDPVWHYLNLQNQRIRGLLEKCTYDYEARLDALQNDIRERAASDAKWKQILQGPSQSPDTNGNTDLAGDAPSVELTGEEVDALKKKYIQKLTSVLIHYLPAFWKIALSVFSGKFAKSSHVATESNAPTSNKIDEKIGDAKYSSHSLDEVSGMMRSTISLYEDKVLDTFREFEESNILQPYMCDSIKEVSKACQVLEVKESAPAIIVMALRAVHAEVSKTYIMRLCSWMRTTIEDLSRDETWVAVSIIERNKSPYRISYLPLAFRSIMISALNQVSQMLQTLKSEAAKTEDVFIPFHEIQESVRLSALNCFLDFAGHLERIGTELTQSRSNRESLYLPNGHSFENSEKSLDLMPGSVVDPHQQLLMVLSNVGYCKDELCYELYNKYKHIWSHSREKDEEDSDKVDLVMAFSALEDKVLEQYTFAKANMIRTAAMSYLLDAGVQWGSAPSVKGVRDAAVELLHTLVAVHAEVFAGAKPLLDKTLGVLVEGLIDTLLSIFHEYESKEFKSVDSNGFCQLMLELEYFETVLNPYFTNDARESLKSLQGMLLEKATESVTEVVENPGHHRRSTRGGEDALADERQQGVSVSPDDLIALAQQCSSELLEAELERTRINTACFAESLPLDSVPESAKSAYASFRGSLDSPSKNYKGAQVVSSPSISKHRRR
uniref:Exocyst complex component SEC5 n=1 Tax=Chenopodium quinoa TaxID=63459 RepID=A0A803LHX8_CHEQI